MHGPEKAGGDLPKDVIRKQLQRTRYVCRRLISGRPAGACPAQALTTACRCTCQGVSWQIGVQALRFRHDLCHGFHRGVIRACVSGQPGHLGGVAMQRHIWWIFEGIHYCDLTSSSAQFQYFRTVLFRAAHRLGAPQGRHQ